MELNEIDEPMVIYCRQSMDYLPNPMACKVTGMTPQETNRTGLCEKDFIEQVVKQIGSPETCSVGYNSIRFDDEVTRHTLFRNFFDPYEHEYKHGSSRWDLLDFVRLTRALRPEGIKWPVNEDGSPNNRLENLTVANGIEHGHAHDALSDVRATIGMAKLIRQKNQKLFDYAFSRRTKQALFDRLNPSNPEVSLLIAGTIPSHRSHITAILPLAIQPDNRNSVIVLDLDQDPSSLLSMDADDIAQRMFTRRTEDNEAESRPGLRTVKINQCPVVMPLNTLRPADAIRLGIDLDRIHRHAETAHWFHESDMQKKIIQVMTRAWPDANGDVEGTLYSGSFLSPADKQRAAELRKINPKSIREVGSYFEDRRLVELAWRFQARNYPDSLDDEQRLNWQDHCRTRLNDAAAPWLTFKQFDEEVDNVLSSASDAPLRQALMEYRGEVYQHAESASAVTGNSGEI